MSFRHTYITNFIYDADLKITPAVYDELDKLGESFFPGTLSKEKAAIVAWLEKMKFQPKDKPFFGHKHLHSDLTDHQVLVLMAEEIAEQRAIREKQLLAQYENGCATELVNEDGELNLLPPSASFNLKNY